jgi:thioredoxin reductase (NADPH)
MYDLIIVGAGPAGIALAAEAGVAGFSPSGTLVLEKAPTHSWTIRHLYPEHKLTTANYKGFEARCEGVLCVGDMTKAETTEYFDRVIADHNINVEYGAEVYAMRRIETDWGGRFRVESSWGICEARFLAVAIGIFGRPNKPKDYRLPESLKDRILFDITTRHIADEDVLVVGGGDSAAEYSELLRQSRNRVTLSYRGTEFARLSCRNLSAIAAMEQRGELEILRGSNIVQLESEGSRARATFKEERYAPRVFDRIVYALGGTTPTNFLRMLGIQFNGDGPIVDDGGETNVPGLFLVGDLVVGRAGGSINAAFNSAAYTMRRIESSTLSRFGGPMPHNACDIERCEPDVHTGRVERY